MCTLGFHFNSVLIFVFLFAGALTAKDYAAATANNQPYECKESVNRPFDDNVDESKVVNQLLAIEILLAKVLICSEAPSD